MTAVPYTPDAPDSQTVRMLFSDHGQSIDRWESYEFSEDFLTPTDSFSFVLSTDEGGLDPRQRSLLRLGARIRLYIGDIVLAEGFVDSVEVTADKSSGWKYAIHGRDRLGQTLDTVAEPTFQLKDGGTLLELLKRLFAPFGWLAEEHFVIDNEGNRSARTGKRGVPTTKGGKKKGPVPLKSFVLHQTKPYNHESVFHFASRVAQRHGLWIWCTSDGEKLIVSKPEFDQEAIFSLRRGLDGRGNVLSGSVKYDMADQPSMIIADSYSGGGEFGKGRCKAYIVNPMLGLTDEGDPTPEVKAVLAKHPAAVENTIPQASVPFRVADTMPFRPMFLHDDESKTQEQLNAFVKREMCLMYRKGVTAHYVVEGHGQVIGDQFVAWAADTVVEVHDEPAELSEQMYVLGVHFSKQRGGSGTTTRLDLIRLHTLSF